MCCTSSFLTHFRMDITSFKNNPYDCTSYRKRECSLCHDHDNILPIAITFVFHFFHMHTHTHTLYIHLHAWPPCWGFLCLSPISFVLITIKPRTYSPCACCVCCRSQYNADCEISKAAFFSSRGFDTCRLCVPLFFFLFYSHSSDITWLSIENNRSYTHLCSRVVNYPCSVCSLPWNLCWINLNRIRIRVHMSLFMATDETSGKFFWDFPLIRFSFTFINIQQMR